MTLNCTPSKRANSEKVVIHKNPSGVWATAVTLLLGRPSSRVQLRIERSQSLAQGGVQGVDRAVPVCGGMQNLARDLHLDCGDGHQLRAIALFNEMVRRKLNLTWDATKSVR